MPVPDDIRRYCPERYVEPVRMSGQQFVEIRSGDVHQPLELRSRYPHVCSPSGSPKFEELTKAERGPLDALLNGTIDRFVKSSGRRVAECEKTTASPIFRSTSWQDGVCVRLALLW